jgi:hypothetical protein
MLKSRCESCFLVLAECILATRSCSFTARTTIVLYCCNYKNFVVLCDLWNTSPELVIHYFLSEVSSLRTNCVQFYFCHHSLFPDWLFCLTVILLFLAYYWPGLFTWKWLFWKLAPKFSVTFSSRLMFKIQLHWNGRCSTVYPSQGMLFNHWMTVKCVTSSKHDDF